ncbi:MAG: O-antigen ligase family protein [Candidatus Buchananbacteria bacterium]|nr:O-antigen ligase family protein [Candidatus Buchananbacteria bacterium]
MARLTKTIEYLFYLFIFLLPWQTRLIWRDASLNGFTWEYGRFSLYGTEILLWVILFLYAAWLIVNRPTAKLTAREYLAYLRQPRVIAYWLVVIFLLLAGFSVIGSIDAVLAYYHWFWLIEAVALFSLIVNFNFSLRRLAVAWVGSAAIQSVFAIWQFFNQYVFANKWLGLAWQFPTQGGSIILQTDSERWLRAYGSLPHPNILAGFLVVALLLLLYLAFSTNTRILLRIFILSSLLVITPALFFSFSRSAWIALIVCLIVLSFWLYRRHDKALNRTFYQIFLLLVLMVVILGLNLTDPLVTRLVGREPLEISSISLRMTFTEQAWNIIQTRPWQGTGVGNYTLGVYHDINSSWPGYYYQPVHNLYLLILAEMGIFGALTFAALLGLLGYMAFRQGPSLEKMIIILSLASCLVISLFDHYFWTLYFGVMVFWVVLALNFRALKGGFDNS